MFNDPEKAITVSTLERVEADIRDGSFPFEKCAVFLAKKLRDQLKQYEDITRMCFTITVEGPVHHGELKITFGIGTYSDTVKSHSIKAMMDEFIRREHFSKAHNGLLLTQTDEVGKASS